jgi:5-enolpyruvylshikimate-3-phosphate synthase
MEEQMEIESPVVGADFKSAPTTGDIPRGLEIQRSKRLRGNITFTGDAHYAMFASAIASLGEEATRLENVPEAPWFQNYRTCLETLGASFERIDNHWLVRRGVAVGVKDRLHIQPPNDIAALILAGLASGLGVPVQWHYDLLRTSSDVRALLSAVYPEGELHRKARNFCKPFELKWDDTLVKIPLMFHHLALGEGLELQLRRQGSDLLETLLRQFEIDLKVERDDDKNADELTRRLARQMRATGKDELLTRVKLPVSSKPKAAFISLPADVGEASIVALVATLIKGSDVLIENVLLNPGRGGFFKALKRMGADIEIVQRKERFGEGVGALRVRSYDLFGKRFDEEALSDLRDETFLLLLAATFAEGESVFRDLEYLHVDEHDPLKSFVADLKQAEVEIGEFEDGLVIRGRRESDGATHDALGHIGLAAAYAVLGLKSHGASNVLGADVLEERFPGLLKRLRFLGVPE